MRKLNDLTFNCVCDPFFYNYKKAGLSILAFWLNFWPLFVQVEQLVLLSLFDSENEDRKWMLWKVWNLFLSISNLIANQDSTVMAVFFKFIKIHGTLCSLDSNKNLMAWNIELLSCSIYWHKRTAQCYLMLAGFNQLMPTVIQLTLSKKILLSGSWLKPARFDDLI